MSRGVPPGVRNDSGFSIVVLLASITIMLVVMGAAVPTWKYIMKNDREEELYFRGDQIARGIERYQRKNGNTFPVSLELMVKGRYLRKVYKDPMTKDGQWRIIHPGEAVLPGGGPGSPGGSRPGSGPRPRATPQPGFPGLPGSARPGGGGQTQGAILGVVSTSKDESLKLMNGRTRYDQWIFLAGQPRILGGAQATPNVLPGGLPPGLGPSPSPGTRPSPLVRP